MSIESSSMKKIYDLALQCYQNGNLKEAEKLFKEVLQSKPNHFSTIFLLGTLYGKNKNFQTAKKLLHKAIKINPNHAETHNNLGNVLQEINMYQDAISSYKKAININPNFAGAYYNLGESLQKLDKHQESISYYQKVIHIDPNYIKAYNNLGNAFLKLGNFKDAISNYQQIIQRDPNYFKAHNNLGIVFNKLNKHQDAVQSFLKTIAIDPNNLTAHWLLMNTFPIVYEKFEEIDIYRKKFEENINKIVQLLDLNPQYSKKQIINALESSTNFYLHYQCRDDLELQTNYSKLVKRLTNIIYPQFHKEIKIKQPINHIKVGFVSSFFRNHSVSKTHKNWIIKLDKNIFKRYVYYVGNEFDDSTDLIKKHADHFFNHTDVDQLIHQISNDSLDVLIYLDIGMSPRIQILSSLRLAPIQCNTWGHPVTSGLKNIDYYFSGALMESEKSQEHYSEELINLPGIGVDYDSTDISSIVKPKIPNKSSKTIFFNLQSLFKLLPQDDHIYLDIAKQHPNSCFWFLQGKDHSITSIFKERLVRLFQEYNLSFEKYSYFHPRCSLDEFLGLIEESDIILDSINWSGCNTSLDAISLNKPIVTLPGSLMRARHAYGILKTLDIEETTAHSKKEYVEIAVKLAKDKSFKDSIIKKIQKNKNRLFNDNQSITFLETFLKNL